VDKASAANQVSAELLAVVQERYRLTPPLRTCRLSGGYANDVFRIDSAGAPVVLHVKHPPVSAGSIAWEHQMLVSLAGWLPEALPPLPAVDGSTWFLHHGRPAWLVAHAPGASAGTQDRRAVADVLGRLHAAPVQVRARPGHPRQLQLPLPELGEYPEDIAAHLPELRLARQELSDLIAVVKRERRPMTGLTHNDIFEGNVLVDRGRVSALIDWEEANLDWLVWDVASTLWPFCSAGDEFDTAAADDFLQAYRDAGGPMPSEEDDLLIPLVRAKRLLEVLRAPTDRHPHWSLQRANLRAHALFSRDRTEDA
jgi:Ser/Thr protein kinase RdoA (MazF antagonist)